MYVVELLQVRARDALLAAAQLEVIGLGLYRIRRNLLRAGRDHLRMDERVVLDGSDILNGRNLVRVPGLVKQNVVVSRPVWRPAQEFLFLQRIPESKDHTARADVAGHP